MFGIHDFPLYIAAAILLNLTPGADTLYIVGRSVAQGRRAGIYSVLGISSGSVVHTIAAGLGLSALLASSTIAFTAVRLVGAVYLVYLGVGLFRSGPPVAGDAVRVVSTLGSWAMYRQGALTNLLNPKVALFYLAFLPQFVEPGSDHRILAFLTLGGVFIATGTAWCLFLAWFASSASRLIRTSPRASRVVRKLVGLAIVGLGLRLATDAK